VESLDVKGAVGWETQLDPYRVPSKLAGRSKCVNRGSPEIFPPRETDRGNFGSAEPLFLRRRPLSTSLPGTDRCRTPRGRGGRHVRKEWSAKARNHSRVA